MLNPADYLLMNGHDQDLDWLGLEQGIRQDRTTALLDLTPVPVARVEGNTQRNKIVIEYLRMALFGLSPS